jgi:periplasmic protein TonB
MSEVAASPAMSRDRRDALRWSGSFVLVAAVYAAAMLALVTWKIPQQPIEMPPAAVMLDLEPLPVPVPQPVFVPPPPPEPEPPPPEPPPEVKPLVTLPPPPPRPRPLVRKPPEPQPTPQVAPAPVQEAPPPVAAAPVLPPAPNPVPAEAFARFEALLVTHLERNKRYPRSAQIRREQGTVRLHFIMDRTGKVLSAQVDASSGHQVLDEEVMALIRRAEPLPAFPAEMTQSQLELIVPIRFSLR